MFAAQHIPYKQTNSFSRLVLDYLNGADALRPFYSNRPDLDGMRKMLAERQQYPTNRPVLVQVLKEQYAILEHSQAVKENIDALLNPATFTVCTAHQPNLFTGPLYFVYKVLHTIKLATFLKEQFPANHFVPVYYMGSEDADFAELNHTYVDGKKIEWKKEQKGAVGRMKVDKTLLQLIDELEGQLVYEPFGKEVVAMLRKCYTTGRTIQDATFELVNELYGEWGLVVLIPDNPSLKGLMKNVFAEDIFENTSSLLVEQTSARLDEHYKVQAYPREINLFYLYENIRERIEKREDRFYVLNTDKSFTEDELKQELESHPERFSPNVILRGLYQETILPNLAFIGGGGETAYWLQLQDIFRHYGVPYPVLVLRNSFLIVEEKWQERLKKIGLSAADLFQSDDDLMKEIVTRQSGNSVSLNGNFEKAEALYEQLRLQAETIDQTLSQYVSAIRTRSLKELQELEKKMLRAEKRKFADQQRQIQALKETLFPRNGLQERVENFSGFYAKWGAAFIAELLRHSPALEQVFTILSQTGSPSHPL
ncbi:bacillithiol biosynthesis cysteine-adding enzyme BshC [Flavisolibacter nicotianae]|uniref:bacillithiol biosynthesis cysteine-adding enzyme BshC n=1 Tax=Flavisolibacter nicotianae TaxID=2364882 RepID=UPI000EB1D764|nr:bacillithiol biosynthesis cysteine-adding enzyme BshC [Flavisolibacter nicotianae]